MHSRFRKLLLPSLLTESTNDITSLLKGISDNSDFLNSLDDTLKMDNQHIGLTKFDLINGWCNEVATFVHSLIPGSEILYSGNGNFGHTFIRYNGKYYDGFNYDGVTDPKDLEYCKRYVSSGDKELFINSIRPR